MKTKNLLSIAITILTCIASAQAQNVNIPDGIFNSYLLNNTAINTNGDSEIQVSEASVFNGGIYLYAGPGSGFGLLDGITDLTGIEAFVSLTYLDCSWNQLSSLNLSACTALTYLNCSSNGLTSLDLSSCTALTGLDCSYNQLTSLDVSNNTALTVLYCYNIGLTSLNVSANSDLTSLVCSSNQLTSLDVSSNTALTELYCSFNELTSLDVSANTALTGLGCGNNQLTTLDVSACSTLTSLDCSFNQLTSLDVSINSALTTLYCWNNLLTILDVSANTTLISFWCSSNQLTCLNVNNGNNINMYIDSYYSFSAENNPNLSCIEVDDVAWSNANWANIDSTASFSLNCNCSGAGISDINESNEPMFYPNPTTGSIYLSEPANITLSDLSGKLLLEEKNTNQLDLSALPAGMYFLNIGENNQQIVKVIKE